ncbi:polyribonucleotide nucleotidyltransferase [Candidatus Legionella polyplacis]|uniref:Polyribonucleotide nucleotidyltransferase n=1 Tax=Candidatus Legionella polyplacis TaxID=2005262 RepID=A0ABZ2GXN5_9GAMM
MKVAKKIQYGNHILTIETGEIARQADSSVFVSMGGTQVLVTVVSRKDEIKNKDFFPLTVYYQEKTFSAGKIPGGYNRREGRLSEYEILVSRLIDRSLRPIFDSKFNEEIQIIATVMSLNPEVPSDILSIIGSSAALMISGLSFNEPVGSIRVGYKNGIYLLNPSYKVISESDLDLVVSGVKDSIIMVDSRSNELSEEIILGAMFFGHMIMQDLILMIKDFAEECLSDRNYVDCNISSKEYIDEQKLYKQLSESISKEILKAYSIKNKVDRQLFLRDTKKNLILNFCNEDITEDVILKMFCVLERFIIRNRIINGELRIDGRTCEEIRPISIKTNFLERVHGSALFTRGETQAIVAVTLGNDRDAQTIDRLFSIDIKDRFILHYNFLPYAVKEIGILGSPKRREIGHGYLAKKSLLAVLPKVSEFPYVIRVVSEITESNGSSSMATVCGSSLALMDAGVPLKSHVAGVAMGLIKEEEKFVVLTDIIGDEDHLGDMDFKVCGTKSGITALQMDIKIKGITKEMFEKILNQSSLARMKILDTMYSVLLKNRDELSKYAPRIDTLMVSKDKIRNVIGKGGSVIKGLIETTGVSININDNGIVQLFSTDKIALEEAKNRIRLLVSDIEVGKTYKGKVNKIVDFGAFIKILPGRDGLLHISQISPDRSKRVSDILQEGQEIDVFVSGIDRQGRIKLEWKRERNKDQ